jgi:hypothetical protein
MVVVAVLQAQMVAMEVRMLPEVLAVYMAVAVAEVVVVVLTLLVALEQMAQFVLFGPATLVHSHQLVRVIYNESLH